MKHSWLAAILACIAGCGQREVVRPPSPPTAHPRRGITAAEYSVMLAGKDRDEVALLLGKPAFTYSNFWRYDDKAWNEYTKKRCSLYVRFADDGTVASCD